MNHRKLNRIPADVPPPPPTLPSATERTPYRSRPVAIAIEAAPPVIPSCGVRSRTSPPSRDSVRRFVEAVSSAPLSRRERWQCDLQCAADPLGLVSDNAHVRHDALATAARELSVRWEYTAAR